MKKIWAYWPLFVGVALIIVIAGVSIAERNERAEAEPTAEATTDDGTMFTAVRDACELPQNAIGDGGTTLILDGEGREDATGLTVQEMACALGAIGTPDSIIARMDQTRALDGQQSADHDGYGYSWSFHPNSGLHVVVTDSWQS